MVYDLLCTFETHARGAAWRNATDLTREDRGHTVNMAYTGCSLEHAIWLSSPPITKAFAAGIHVIPAMPHKTKRKLFLGPTI